MQSITGIFRKLTTPIQTKSADSDGKQEIKGKYEPEEKFVTVQKPEVPSVQQLPSEDNVMTEEMTQIKELVYDLIKDIRDPEKPQTLEELNVVNEDDIVVQHFTENKLLVQITFVPTVPHCSLASLIGLSLRRKITTCLPEKHKLDIFVKKGTHDTAEEINKQINDKERISAAMENPSLRELVDKCISEEEEFG